MKEHQFYSGLAWTQRDAVTDSEMGRKLYQQALSDCLRREHKKRANKGG